MEFFLGIYSPCQLVAAVAVADSARWARNATHTRWPCFFAVSITVVTVA
jgi:hypothetical protein